jgi:multidrug resistance efflux pump
MIAIAAISLGLATCVNVREHRRRRASIEAALADYQRAKAAVDMSDIALTEYVEHASRRMLERAQNEVDQAEVELKRLHLPIDASMGERRDNDRWPTERPPERSNLQSLEARLADARNRLRALGVRQEQTIKILRSDLARAELNEAAAKATYEKLQDGAR